MEAEAKEKGEVMYEAIVVIALFCLVGFIKWLEYKGGSDGKD